VRACGDEAKEPVEGSHLVVAEAGQRRLQRLGVDRDGASCQLDPGLREAHALLSFLMVAVVTGIATVRTTGIGPETPALWWGAFLVSWPVAFPTVLLVAPLVRRAVARLAVHESSRNTAAVTGVTAA
jgi:hypothetical protein